MKAVVSVLILCIIGICIVLRLYFRMKKVRNGKEKKIREEYAAESVTLLIVLAMDIVAAIGGGLSYSFWDILGEFLGIKQEPSDLVSVVSIVGLVAVFVLCCRLVAKTYGQWSGPVSRRQHSMNVEQMEKGKLLHDFLYYIFHSMAGNNPELRKYIPVPEAQETEENSITNERLWYKEFADIYSIMSNQAHIDIDHDWHKDNKCFISEYASQKIAICCENDKPDRSRVLSFLEYIHALNPRYFRIIIAVKNGDEKNYKEQFGDCQVEYIFKENALDDMVDFSEYYYALGKLYERPVMTGSSLGIEDIYVEPRCKEEKSGNEQYLKKYVRNWLEEEGNRHLALLGDFGQGKTVFAIRMCYEMIKEKHPRIPVFIPLRNKSPRNSTKEEIFSYFGVQYGIHAKALDLLNKNGRLLLVFDGFDEMDLVGNSEIRLRHFKSLWELACPKSKILITGRPNYFLSREEMVKAFGFLSDTAVLPYCEELRLLLFDEKQIAEALRNAPQTVQDGISRIIKNRMSASFSDLICRPSHLFLISLIWTERELEKKYKNLTSATVIHEFLQSCFERQSQKSTATPYFYLSSAEREYFMTGIAVRMYKLGITVISAEAFQDAVQDLIEAFPDRLSAKNPVNLNLRNGESVKEFAEKNSDSLFAIINDVRSCGVLVNDYANNGLAFAHKSFLDLLVAKFFAGRMVRLHNRTMLIADSIAAMNAYNIRLKNDFVVRKLTAELISAEVAANIRENNYATKCWKIYEQCYKIIFRFPIVLKPRHMLGMCLKQQKKSRIIHSERWNRKGEKTNLLRLFAVGLICMAGFLIRAGQIMFQYEKEMEELSGMITGSASDYVYVTSFSWMILGVLVVLLVSGKIISVLEGKAEMSVRNRADIMMLTWYYSCLDNHIPQKEILRWFPKRSKNAFLKYVEGININN